jgi:hypothetical protein
MDAQSVRAAAVMRGRSRGQRRRRQSDRAAEHSRMTTSNAASSARHRAGHDLLDDLRRGVRVLLHVLPVARV